MGVVFLSVIFKFLVRIKLQKPNLEFLVNKCTLNEVLLKSDAEKLLHLSPALPLSPWSPPPPFHLFSSSSSSLLLCSAQLNSTSPLSSPLLSPCPSAFPLFCLSSGMSPLFPFASVRFVPVARRGLIYSPNIPNRNMHTRRRKKKKNRTHAHFSVFYFFTISQTKNVSWLPLSLSESKLATRTLENKPASELLFNTNLYLRVYQQNRFH